MCCAFVGMDNKLYKMHSKYIKIHKIFLLHVSVLWPLSGSTATYIDRYFDHD